MYSLHRSESCLDAGEGNRNFNMYELIEIKYLIPIESLHKVRFSLLYGDTCKYITSRRTMYACGKNQKHVKQECLSIEST